MTDREMAFNLVIWERVLTVIKLLCERGRTCSKCPFFRIGLTNGCGCLLAGTPQEWNLDGLFNSTKEKDDDQRGI